MGVALWWVWDTGTEVKSRRKPGGLLQLKHKHAHAIGFASGGTNTHTCYTAHYRRMKELGGRVRCGTGLKAAPLAPLFPRS